MVILAEESHDKKGKSTTGMEENVAGLLCYVLGLITGNKL
jgi:hypothetical protein